MGQTSGAGIQLVVSEADAWPPSAELTVGSLQDDTTTDTLGRHTLAWMTCKSGCSLLDRSQPEQSRILAPNNGPVEKCVFVGLGVA